MIRRVLVSVYQTLYIVTVLPYVFLYRAAFRQEAGL
jgi:hypothetical protein